MSNKYKVETNTRGAYLSASNNYDMFYKAAGEFIDNSISARADIIHIHMDLDTVSKYSFFDNGIGLSADEVGVKRLNVIFDIKRTEDKDGALNEHGTGVKGASFAIGQPLKFWAKQKGKKVLHISNYDFNHAHVYLGWEVLDDKKVFDDIGFESGFKAVISSKRIDGKDGLTLFKSNRKDQKSALKEFYNDIHTTYLFAINKGLKIKISSVYKGEILEEKFLSEASLPGDTFISASNVKSADGSLLRIWLQENCSKARLKGTPFERIDNKEEQKYFIMHDKVLFMPDNGDTKYGRSMKDASLSHLKIFIEVVKASKNVRTTTTKSGLVNNEAFKSISNAIDVFWNYHVKREIQKKGSNLSNSEYFKAVKAGEPIYVEFGKHDILKDKKAAEFKKSAKSINDHIGKKVVDVFTEFSVNILTENGNKTYKLDFAKVDYDNKIFTIGEVKVKDFNPSNAVQVAMYAKSVKNIYSDYKIDLVLVAPSISPDVKALLELIPLFNSIHIDSSDF